MNFSIAKNWSIHTGLKLGTCELTILWWIKHSKRSRGGREMEINWNHMRWVLSILHTHRIRVTFNPFYLFPRPRAAFVTTRAMSINIHCNRRCPVRARWIVRAKLRIVENDFSVASRSWRLRLDADSTSRRRADMPWRWHLGEKSCRINTH